MAPVLPDSMRLFCVAVMEPLEPIPGSSVLVELFGVELEPLS